MRRAATLGLTIALVSSSVFSIGTVIAAETAATVKAANNVVSGTADAAGNVIDASGKVVGRVTDTSAAPETAAGVADNADGNDTGTAGDTATSLTFGPATDVLGMSLDSRRADIDRLIADAVLSSKLNQQQAADLRTQLDKISELEAQARLSANSMTFDEAINIAGELDSLSSKVSASLSQPPLPPLVVADPLGKAAPRMVVTAVRRTGTPLSALGDIVAGSVDASGIITDATGKAVGKVHPTTAVKPGDTTSGTTAFGAQSVADMLSARRAELERIVAQGEASGKLTDEQAAAFRLEIHITSNTEEELRTTESVMTFDEAITLARALDDLSKTVGKALNVRFPSLVVNDAAGNPRLAINTYRMSVPVASTETAASSATTAGGAITVSDEFAGAATALNGTAASAGAISSTQAGNDAEAVPIGATGKLAIDYTPDNVPDTWWAILESRRMQLEQAIGRALGQGTISARQTAELRSELFRITRSIYTTKADVNPITMDQAAVIAGELDRLSARVATAAKIAPLPKLEENPDARLRIVLDNFGDITKASSIRPVAYVVTLDSRRAEIESGIATAQSAGKLSPDQAAEFRRWLNRIGRAEKGATTSGGMTLEAAAPLAVELDLLSKRLSAFLSIPIVPLVVGTRLMLVGNQVVMIGETTLRRADIEARINREVLAGGLTAEQANKLRADLVAVGQAEQTARADGSMNVDEMMSLFASIDRVDDTLNRYIAASRNRNQSVLVVPSPY